MSSEEIVDSEEEITRSLMDAINDSIDQDGEPPEALDQQAPDSLYFFPLLRRPFFPGMAAPLQIEPGKFYDLLKHIASTSHKTVGLVLTKSETADLSKIESKDLHRVGVLAKIFRIAPNEQGGGAQVIFSVDRRVILDEPVGRDQFLKIKVSYPDEEVEDSTTSKAYAISIISTIRELLKVNPLFKEELQLFLGQSDFTEPSRLADFAAALTTADRAELQDVLETFDVEERATKALVLLKKELDVSTLQNNLSKKIEASIAKTQKEYFLREQMKTIKKELGLERDDKALDREKFEARMKERTVPPAVATVINDEMGKLSVLDVQAAEYGVCRGYLDWLTIMPWGIQSSDCHDIATAEAILNSDHYGLEDIKLRILEFISIGKLAGGIKGSILCLVGPPGVGKTSIGKSIARALNRKFYRFSVGGMRDEAEIKGHRRTYVGAMPGKIIQALKQCQTMNPVIMLDEIDKIGNSFRGDPASALLEVLDPEQNCDFLDHYLDVRCDLSNVLFVVTANVLDTIPEALKDRMEILRLSGYIAQEKVKIAQKYLIPRNRKEMGLKTTQIEFASDGLRTMINGYAREAGVRTLENLIKKTLRKVAFKLVKLQEAGEPVVKTVLKPANIHEFLGKPLFTTDRFYDITPVGVCMGLAWTAMGGATLYVEAIKVPGKKGSSMILTGQAGPVMKESAEIAWSYLHGALHKYAPGYTYFEKSQVHIHIPEGATPKDGPSAGVTLTTALLSLLLNMPILENLGMTGELTLTGRVLAIGGLKEKIVAARRSGVERLIFPKDNMRDYDELPNHLKKGMIVHFVEHYDEIVPIAFPDH
jgi:ATP-dependent Lon protease